MKIPELSINFTESYPEEIKSKITQKSESLIVGEGLSRKIKEETNRVVIGQKKEVDLSVEEGENIEEKEHVRGEGDGHQRDVGNELVDADQNPHRFH